MRDRRSLRASDLGSVVHHKGLQTARVHLGGQLITRLELLSALGGPGPSREVSRVGHLLCARTPRLLRVRRLGGASNAQCPTGP